MKETGIFQLSVSILIATCTKNHPCMCKLAGFSGI